MTLKESVSLRKRSVSISTTTIIDLPHVESEQELREVLHFITKNSIERYRHDQLPMRCRDTATKS